MSGYEIDDYSILSIIYDNIGSGPPDINYKMYINTYLRRKVLIMGERLTLDYFNIRDSLISEKLSLILNAKIE